MTEPFSPPRSTQGPAQESPTGPRPGLRRSREDRVVAGVCGGLGRYLGIDPVVVRIVMVALIFAGVGVLAYIIAWIAIPDTAPGDPEPAAPVQDRRATAVVVGAALIALGGLLVVRQAVPGFDQAMLWPLVVLGAGVAVLITSRR